MTYESTMLFKRTLLRELWICLQVPQAAARIGPGAGYRHNQAEMIEPLLRNKISQPRDCTQASFLNPSMAELNGFSLGNRTRKLFPATYRLLGSLAPLILQAKQLLFYSFYN